MRAPASARGGGRGPDQGPHGRTLYLQGKRIGGGNLHPDAVDNLLQPFSVGLAAGGNAHVELLPSPFHLFVLEWARALNGLPRVGLKKNPSPEPGCPAPASLISSDMLPFFFQRWPPSQKKAGTAH